MIILTILTASLIHFSLKGWENVLFGLGSEKGKPYKLSLLLNTLERITVQIRPATHMEHYDEI